MTAPNEPWDLDALDAEYLEDEAEREARRAEHNAEALPVPRRDRPSCDLRLGDYRDALDGETWDALICDPPYSARTHKWHNDKTSSANRVRDWADRVRAKRMRGEPLTANELLADRRVATAERTGVQRRLLTYSHFTPDDVRAFVAWAAPRTRGWMVLFCDQRAGAAAWARLTLRKKVTRDY